jgi:tetratricopeptide (TPR) repeat protein
MGAMRGVMRSIAVILAVLAVPAGAAAQEDDAPEGAEDSAEAMEMAAQHMDDERARSHFEAGRNLYDAGAFERAGQEFEEAYALSSRPELLYNIYVAFRDAGDVRKARDALRTYLTEMTNAPDRANLEARLESLESQAAALEETEQADRERRENEERRQREEEERRREAEAAAESGPSIAPWIVAGAGAAMLLAGAVTGVLALGAVGDIEDECENDICPSSYEELEEDRDSARTLVRVTDYLLLGGTIVLAAGVTWWFLSSGDDEEPAVTAGCGPDGCSAVLRGAF